MQRMNSAPMRDSQINSKVPAPEKKGSIGKVPSDPVGKKPGGKIAGFSGGIKPGKC